MAQIEHRIHRLQPAAHWLLLVDETGSQFKGVVDLEHEGRVVLVAVPSGVHLRSKLLKTFHAVELNENRVLRVLEHVIQQPLGVFGLSRRCLDAIHRSGHNALLEETLFLALMQLPLDGEAKIKIVIEERGGAIPGDYRAMADALKGRLRRTDPERARLLQWTEKSVIVTEKTGHAWLAAADAIAYAWGSGKRSMREAIRRTNLNGGCLFEEATAAELEAAHWVAPSIIPSAEQWESLLLAADRQPAGLAPLWRDRLFQRMASDTRLWQAMQQAVQALVTSSTMDLSSAMRAIRALSQLPSPQDVGLVMALLLATMELHVSNHAGNLLCKLEDNVRRAALELRDEHPALASQALLVAAVTRTNAFDFEGARTLADGPLALGVAELGGLRQAGRVASLRGQIEAFLGNPGAADAHFETALKLFAQLSEPRERAAETTQTATYRAIAAVDDPDRTDDEAMALVGEVVPLTPESIRAMSTDHRHENQYRHHLLVRTLAMRGTAQQVQVYVEGRTAWEQPFGHPWPLIQFYRSLLVAGTVAKGGRGIVLRRNEGAADARAMAASAIAACTASGLGPVMHVMALALHRVAREVWPDLDAPAIDRSALREILPCAQPQLAALERPLDGRPLRELLVETLPFNFH